MVQKKGGPLCRGPPIARNQPAREQFLSVEGYDALSHLFRPRPLDGLAKEGPVHAVRRLPFLVVVSTRLSSVTVQLSSKNVLLELAEVRVVQGHLPRKAGANHPGGRFNVPTTRTDAGLAATSSVGATVEPRKGLSFFPLLLAAM
jgi:hypothetical protein